MHVWLNLKTIKCYLIKLATDFEWQPSYLVGERASLDPIEGSPEKVNKIKIQKKKMIEIAAISNFYKYFCVGATFEMRTVLYGICLLIDKLEMVDRVFFIKHWKRGREQDSGETEREREGKRECERQSTAENKG
jgi:hypothetical protein